MSYIIFKTCGQLLEHLLKERNWSQKDLSNIINITESTVSRIIANKKPIDIKMALLLEEVFKVSAEEFIKIQFDYDLAKARLEIIPDEKIEKKAYLLGDFPIKEMNKRGWINIENIKNIESVEKEICHFFEVREVEEVKEITHFAKKTDVYSKLSPSQSAWLYRVKKIATEILVPKYSKQKLKNALEEIKTLMSSAKELRQIPRILTEAGVRFLIVEALPSSKIDGASFWLNDSPVIALTMRFDRIDNFCFVLRHECEHILREDGKNQGQGINIDIEMEKENLNLSEVEKRANLVATEFCVPEKLMDAFIVRKDPLFDKNSLIGFANLLKIHPGIVVGQLQQRTGRYNLFRDYLVKVRDYIIPNAYTDGWGSVFPIS